MTMGGRRRWVLVGGIGVILLLAGASELRGQNATRPEVVSLRFEGNEAFGDRALSGAILTRQTQCRSTVLAPFCWVGRDFALDRAFLNPRWLRDDYLRIHLYYRQRGYAEVQVDTVVTRPTETTAEIAFRIQEGVPHRVASLEFFGLEDVEDREGVTRGLPIRLGDPLNRVVLEATRDTIVRRLRNGGYPHTEVFRSLQTFQGSYDASVEFEVFTGPRARFGPIEVTGNEKVETAVVRRMLPFREDTPYSQELLFDAQRNLFNLEIFRRARVIQDLDHQPDSVVPLLVEVTEGSTHRVRTGGGWNSAECFNAESRWSSRNFLGGARRLVLRGRVSNVLTSQLEDSVCWGAGTEEFGELNWLISSEFTQPFLFSPRNTFTASLFMERQSLQDVFVRRAEGLNLVLTRRLGRATSASLAYRPQRARLEAAEVFFCTSFLVCRPEDVELLQGSNLLSPVVLSLARDRTDQAFNPRRGYRFLMDLEHASAWTGSNFPYDRAVGEAVSFHEVFGETVLGLRLRGGWMRPRPFRDLLGQDEVDPRVAHPQKRFFAGGSNSVRGFAQNQLGPRVVSIPVQNLVFPVGGAEAAVCAPESVADLSCDASPLDEGFFSARPSGGGSLLEGSMELRFPVWGGDLDGAAFLDFGQVWPTAGEVRLRDMELTPGLGARYQTPVGPIRIDVAYRAPRVQELSVVTPLVRPFDPDRDRAADRLRRDDTVLDWVALDELALLGPRVPFDERNGFFRRIQFHLSIGHAF